MLHEGVRKMFHRWKIRRLDDDAAVEGAPGMIVEVAAHHLAELRPFVEAAVAGVRAHHAFPVILDERHEILFLLIGPVAFTGDEEKYRVEIIEIARVSRR